MMSQPATSGPRMSLRTMLNKVPEVTVFFWIVKILSTTVGETAADLMAESWGFGLVATTGVMTVLLATALVFQFRSRRYVPAIYWLNVVLISIVGTLVTDNLTDSFGVPLITTTIVFSVALAATFIAWYAKERTLSIHSITTSTREGFYWLAILFTFALGTAAGDLVAEKLKLGYGPSLLLFVGLIAAVAGAHYALKLNAVCAFWLAYILTRPLGASTGDLLSQPKGAGGFGFGTTSASVVFLLIIAALVAMMTLNAGRRAHRSADPAVTA